MGRRITVHQIKRREEADALIATNLQFMQDRMDAMAAGMLDRVVRGAIQAREQLHVEEERVRIDLKALAEKLLSECQLQVLTLVLQRFRGWVQGVPLKLLVEEALQQCRRDAISNITSVVVEVPKSWIDAPADTLLREMAEFGPNLTVHTTDALWPKIEITGQDNSLIMDLGFAQQAFSGFTEGGAS